MSQPSPDEANLTKRERQKLRREQRLQQEAQTARSARRRRLATLTVIVVLALAAVGVFVQRQIAERQAAVERREEVAGRLAALGCGEIEEMADQGQGHITQAQMAANPPDSLYPEQPATSGTHFGGVVASGVYDEAIDERITTHNLEHGYVIFWHGEGADDAEVAELEEFAQAQIGDGQDKLIVAPYPGELPDGVNFSTVAWNFRQNCAEFDPDVALTFMDDHYGLAGRAPEKTIAAHTGDGQGVLDPAAQEGPLLFPPLAGDQPEVEATATAPDPGEPAAETVTETPAAE